MAIFHLSAKPVQRSHGRSSTAAAAYRSGESISDQRTGEVHDYTRKQGVEHSEIITPGNEIIAREKLWNAAEAAEKRKDGTPAREYEIALPNELTAEQRKELAQKFAIHLAKRYGCAVDLSIHAPGKEGDHRNHHAHILCTTRRFEGGKLGAKCDVELSDKDRAKKGLPGRKAELDTTRATWAWLTNQALARAGLAAIHVSHKSLEARGIDREPTTHLGPTATAMERRGVRTDRGDLNRGQAESQANRGELAALERQESGMSAARSRAHDWKLDQARTAADAQRQATLELERQRQQEDQERARQQQEREKKREAERKAREEQRQKEPRKRGRDQGVSR